MLKEITENMKQMATEKAKGDLALSSTYIDDVMSGDWQVKNNKLYKGQTQINGNEDIVDLLGEKTGDTISLGADSSFAILHDIGCNTSIALENGNGITCFFTKQINNIFISSKAILVLQPMS